MNFFLIFSKRVLFLFLFLLFFLLRSSFSFQIYFPFTLYSFPQKYLKKYAAELSKKLKSAESKFDDPSLQVACVILNTADYCCISSDDIQAKMKEVQEIEPLFFPFFLLFFSFLRRFCPFLLLLALFHFFPLLFLFFPFSL